jgi:hypothetical protein
MVFRLAVMLITMFRLSLMLIMMLRLRLMLVVRLVLVASIIVLRITSRGDSVKQQESKCNAHNSDSFHTSLPLHQFQS